MNTTIISGNITRDVEIVTTKSDWSILKFSIANNDESRKQQDGSYENIASFFDCEYLTKKPDTWIRRLHKGSAIVIQGTLKQEQWEDKNGGGKRSKVKISVQGFPMNLASRDEMQGNSAPLVPQAQTFSNPPVQNAGTFKSEPIVSTGDFDSDIPF